MQAASVARAALVASVVAVGCAPATPTPPGSPVTGIASFSASPRQPGGASPTVAPAAEEIRQHIASSAITLAARVQTLKAATTKSIADVRTAVGDLRQWALDEGDWIAASSDGPCAIEVRTFAAGVSAVDRGASSLETEMVGSQSEPSLLADAAGQINDGLAGVTRALDGVLAGCATAVTPSREPVDAPTIQQAYLEVATEVNVQFKLINGTFDGDPYRFASRLADIEQTVLDRLRRYDVALGPAGRELREAVDGALAVARQAEAAPTTDQARSLLRVALLAPLSDQRAAAARIRADLRLDSMGDQDIL